LGYKQGQQAGWAKRTQIEFQGQRQGGFFLVQNKKKGQKGQSQWAAGRKGKHKQFIVYFFPYISNGNNNSNNSTTNSIFELPIYNNAMDFFQFCDI
jgi:hypothetical protein